MVETKLYRSEESSWHPRYVAHGPRKGKQSSGRITVFTIIKCVLGPRPTLLQFIKILILLALSITCIFNLKFIIETKNKLDQDRILLNPDYILQSNHLEDEALHVQNEFAIDQKERITQIKAISSKELVKVIVNNVTVHEDSSPEEGRGIHLVVLNQLTEKVMSERVFDTFVTDQEEHLINFIDSISNEKRILVFAVKDEAAFSLKERGRNKLKSLGSKVIDDLQWRGMWIMICTKSGILFDEKISNTDNTATWAAPITSNIKLKMEDITDQESCNWGNTQIDNYRRKFCSLYEGYGDLCSCINPLPLSFQTSHFQNNIVWDVPVAVIASNRPVYLFRALRSLLSARGVNRDMITVFIDGQFKEPLGVCKFLQIKAIQHDPVGVGSARVSQHYKASLAAIFDLHIDAKYTIIVEEDLDVSPDFFLFFSQTLPLLDQDDSLYCISAWNDQGYEHSIGDPSLLYRVETMPGLGWLLKRSLFEELEPNWPTPEKQWDWDMWVRHESNRLGRECVIPDVSRTYHFGETGVNMNQRFFNQYFKTHAFNTDGYALLHNTELLTSQNYEQLMHSLIQSGTILNGDISPCDVGFIDESKHSQNNHYVAYFKMTEGDTSSFMKLLKCLKLFDLEPRGLHKHSFRTFIKKRHVIFIAYPVSPYSIYKPMNVNMLQL